MHKAHVRISINIWEKYLAFQGIDPAVTDNVRISNDVRASLATITRFDCMQPSNDLPWLLFEGLLFGFARGTAMPHPK